jgi:hypothetical protein
MVLELLAPTPEKWKSNEDSAVLWSFDTWDQSL